MGNRDEVKMGRQEDLAETEEERAFESPWKGETMSLILIRA
jgi:hypothetical protein